jgi:hypothetical protein
LNSLYIQLFYQSKMSESKGADHEVKFDEFNEILTSKGVQTFLSVKDASTKVLNILKADLQAKATSNREFRGISIFSPLDPNPKNIIFYASGKIKLWVEFDYYDKEEGELDTKNMLKIYDVVNQKILN